MQFKIQLSIVGGQGETISEEISVLDRSMDTNDLVGLALAESKQILKRLQQTIVREQAQHYTQSNRCCPNCQGKRRIKDTYDIQYRTLFGIVTIPNLRLMHCQCSANKTKSFSVLNEWMTEHICAELQYMETKWASLMSYAMTVDLLKRSVAYKRFAQC